MSLNILIADDDDILRNLLCDILKKQGYCPIPVSDGKQALEIYFSSIEISLCILDVMMPYYNGWEVLEEIRAIDETTPILMLTALEDEEYEIKGLLNGADDYISKPFSYPVFIARIESLLRKTKKNLSSIHEYGKIKIDKQTHKVFISDDEIILNNKEYRLLCYLTSNKNIVLSREQILSHIWGLDYDGDIRTVDAHIKMLRNKLESCSDYIITIRGFGYKFEV